VPVTGSVAKWVFNAAFGNKSIATSMCSLFSVITAPVPVSAAVWLFGSGLLGLIPNKIFPDDERRPKAEVQKIYINFRNVL
jgi:hypothetical protein